MNGCSDTCPCVRWINCRQYQEIYNNKWKALHGDEHIAIINEWYDTKFRLTSYYPDGFGNG